MKVEVTVPVKVAMLPKKLGVLIDPEGVPAEVAEVLRVVKEPIPADTATSLAEVWVDPVPNAVVQFAGEEEPGPTGES